MSIRGAATVLNRWHGAAKMKPASVSIVAMLLAAVVGGCGSQSSAATKIAGGRTPPRVSSAPVVTRPGQLGNTWKPVATITGRAAAWITRRSGVTLLRFDQRLVHLTLHAGLHEPGGQGWTYGDHIVPSEIHRVLAALADELPAGAF
jgi:hypothetical protein